MTGNLQHQVSGRQREVAPRNGEWRDFLRLKPFLRGYVGRLAFIVALSLVGSLLGLVQPYVSKYLVDQALLRRDAHALLIAAALMCGATVLGFLLTYASGFGYMRISSAMLFDMRLEVFRHLHALSPRFYARSRVGDLVSRLNGDVAEVQRVASDSLLSLLSNFLFITGSLFTMIWLSWKLFIVGTVLLPLSVALFRWYHARLTALAREMRERSAEIGTLFVESLLGVRLLACFNGAAYEVQRFRDRNGSFIAAMLRFQKTSLLGRMVPGGILSVATIAVFLYGGHQVIVRQMTIGTLVAFMAYHARLLSPVQNLLGLSASLTSAKVSLARVLELLDTKPEVVETPGALPLATVRQGIAFRNVTLRHDGRAILNDVSFELPAGSFTAIVGPSGSGKSSAADLMVRLLDPDEGAVLVDGVDVRHLRLSDLRRSVVLIDQCPHVLHGSFFENIAYAQPHASRSRVEEAAEAAGLGDLIVRLPAGIDTVAGERGLALSAGERQRLAIARAFLLDPDVLILDEPSAALDAEREFELLQTLRQRFAGKTLIVITHKPCLASAADCVVTIDNGRVAPEVLV